MPANLFIPDPALDAVPAPDPVELAGAATDLARTPGIFNCPRDFLGNRFVYLYVSSRTGGLAIGVNMNPDGLCDFNCAYCEVDRAKLPRDATLELDRLAEELRATLDFVHSDRLQTRTCFGALPPELRRLRQVTLTGDGEPTLSPVFCGAVETVLHLRAVCRLPFFKLVLVTNCSALDQPHVQQGLQQFTRNDEIWVKLDVGTQAGFTRVNRAPDTLERILRNILLVARERPVVIQTMLARINGENLSATEVLEYIARLRELRDAGARISSVQIYSANRPTPNADCQHLPLKTLSDIAQQVRAATGLKVAVF